jgi:hypothetical protein
MIQPILLREALPTLAMELEELLQNEGEPALAAQVNELPIVERCRCGDDFCASFYTQAKPKDGHPPGYRSVEVEPAEGMIIVDVVAEKIAHVEILNRDDVRKTLLTLLP